MSDPEGDDDDRREAYMQRRQRSFRGCLCGYPDWPGRCPGAAACPAHGENLDDQESD